MAIFSLHMYIALCYNEDFFSVLDETTEVVQWFTLGLCLKMKPFELEGINADYRFNHYEGRVQMLSAWLKGGCATWSSLVRALRKMGQSFLANKIAMKKGAKTLV